MENEILIGVYEETGELIGYKTDSFWSLSPNREYAKIDNLTDGKIREVLVGNLRSILRQNGTELIGAIQKLNKKHYFDNFETRLLGYELEGIRYFTHRIFDNDVQELTSEDLERLERLKN